VVFTPRTTCETAPPATITGLVASAGCETTVQFSATFNGNLVGNRLFRLEVIRGPFFWVHPITGVVDNSVTVNSDHAGNVLAIMRVAGGIPTQVGVLRIIDVETGVYADHAFTITGATPGATLTPIPNSFTFTGPDDQTCGTGSGEFFVFDGLPPYSALSSNNNVTVEALDPNSNPGRFRITATNPNVCVTGTVVVTDSLGGRSTVTVTTVLGTNPAPTPPPPALAMVPNTVTVTCGQSASSLIIGGDPAATTFSAVSNDPNVTVSVAGRTVTVTRAGAPPPTPPNVNSIVTVTDGSSVAQLRVNNPQTCS
jgi:hypothetical protein